MNAPMLTSCNGAVFWNSFVPADKSCTRYTKSVSKGWKRAERTVERKSDKEKSAMNCAYFDLQPTLVYITNALTLCPQAIHQKPMNRTQSMFALWTIFWMTSDNATRQYNVLLALWHICRKPMYVNRRLNSSKTKTKQDRRTSLRFSSLRSALRSWELLELFTALFHNKECIFSHYMKSSDIHYTKC